MSNIWWYVYETSRKVCRCEKFHFWRTHRLFKKWTFLVGKIKKEEEWNKYPETNPPTLLLICYPKRRKTQNNIKKGLLDVKEWFKRVLILKSILKQKTIIYPQNYQKMREKMWNFWPLWQPPTHPLNEILNLSLISSKLKSQRMITWVSMCICIFIWRRGWSSPLLRRVDIGASNDCVHLR